MPAERHTDAHSTCAGRPRPSGDPAAPRARLQYSACDVSEYDNSIRATTQTSTMPEDDGRAPASWWLYLVHHTDPEHLGKRIELGEAALEIGRVSDVFGPQVLADGHISRQHASFYGNALGSPTVRDCGSHNGTFVNGGRIQEHPLSSGDIVGLGRVLLLAIREPDSTGFEAPRGSCGVSHAFRSAVETVRKAAPRGPTILWGESGVGKATLAAELHSASGRVGPLHRVRCGRLPEDGATSLQAALASARGGTLVLHNVEELPGPAQLVVMEALERPARSPDGGDGSSDVGIVACTVESPDSLADRLRPELVNRLRRWSVRVPALTERRPDIPLLATAFARRFTDDARARLGPELTFRLLRHRWPGNLHELEAVIERAAVEATDEVLTTFDGLDAILAQHASSRVISTYGRRVEREPYVVDVQGRWYTTPEGTRHDLERRKTLARVLATLIEARREAPGRALSVADLLERAWAEERLLPRAGANRVYVAVTTLRKLGLRDLLARTDAGYLLDQDVPLRIIEP